MTRPGRMNVNRLGPLFYVRYQEEHWKSCLEYDCPTCEIFERYHPVKRSELKAIKEAIDAGSGSGGESI